MYIFLSFLFFNVKRPDGLSWCPNGWIFVVRTRSGYVPTRATCLHGSEAVRVRTALIHRPDGDPTEAIYTLVAAYPLYPTKIFLFGIL
jgi:hypothetical protein